MRRLANRATGMMLALACALGACQDDFDKPTLVNHPMLLGVHTEVVGDRQRATPAPGETALVQLDLVGPRGSYKTKNLSSLLVVCSYPVRFAGVPICQEFLDLAALPPEELMAMFGDLTIEPNQVHVACEGNITAEALGVALNCITGTPSLEITVNKDTKADDLLLRGVVCTTGQAVFDPTLPELFGCDSAENDNDALTFHSRLRLASADEARNNNPDLAAIQMTINGRNFDSEPDASIPKRKCAQYADVGGPLLIDPYDHLLGFDVPKKAREKLPGGGRETWEFTVYATAGDVIRRFTLFSDDDATQMGGSTLKTVMWNGGGLVDYGESQLVDFWITVRDQRGGFITVPRSACVELPEAIGSLH